MTAAPLAALAGIAAFILIMVLMPEGQGSLLARIENVAPIDEAFDVDEFELRKPLKERLLQPMLAAVGNFMLQRTKSGQIQRLRMMITQAGSDMRPERLLAYKVVGAFVAGPIALAVGTLLGAAPLMLALVGGGAVVLGYLYPSSKLKGRIKKRAAEIRRHLPGVLDLLTISMEAGLSFDMSLTKVCESEGGILGQEFQHALNEVRLGRPRMEALTALAERNGVEEMTTFIRAVVQAEPLGVSVASVLRIQSEELRRLRKQRAEEAGHKAPVLMLLPMMGCIFPCIFIILLGPAVITVVQSMK